MGKFCLLFILSLVSVLSTSAQLRERVVAATEPASTEIRPRYIDNFDMNSGVKVYLPVTKTEMETAQTSNNKASTAAGLKVQKTSPSPAADSSAAFLASKGKSLGGYSTGDSAIDSYIVDSCARYNIDPLLIFAQMNQESAFKLKATSYKGARGLMQLMPGTAIRFGAKNIYDPQQNIEAGVKYMRWLLDKFDGDVRLALAGYNAGEGAVMKYGNQIPPYSETQGYVARITARYDQIKQPNLVRLTSSSRATN